MLMRDGTNTKLQTRGGCIFKQKGATLKKQFTRFVQLTLVSLKKTPIKKQLKYSRSIEIM